MKVTAALRRPLCRRRSKRAKPLGKLVVTAPSTAPIEVPLIAAADVGRMDAIGRVATLAGYLVWGRRH